MSAVRERKVGRTGKINRSIVAEVLCGVKAIGISLLGSGV